MTFPLDEVRAAIRAGRLRWREHALVRLLERGIARDRVVWILLHGDILEEYPLSWPYPAALIGGDPGGGTLHAVVAFAAVSRCAYVVSAYEPDQVHFEPDLRTRRRKEDD